MSSQNRVLGSSMVAHPLNMPNGNTITAALNVQVADPGRFQTKLIDVSWLAAAAPQYNISPDISDYDFGVVRSLTAELPNRNGHNFTFKELVAFNIAGGCQNYRTFEGKPILVNHEYVLEKSIGINVMTSLVQEGPYIFVENIIGIDRTKDPDAADQVKKGMAKFSMGATAPSFNCSVCGETIKDINKPCAHTKQPAILKPHYNLAKASGNIKDSPSVLSYLNVNQPSFYELSYLRGQDPADPRAWSSDISMYPNTK